MSCTREPKTLCTALQLLTDDLLMGEDNGYPCVDSSRSINDPSRMFSMQVSLLFVVGDYPGLGKMTGFGHNNMGKCHCHWCMHATPSYLPGRALFRNHRSHLPEDDWMRQADFEEPHLPASEFPPPNRRTVHESVDQSIAARDHLYGAPHHPGRESGIYNWCPLTLLDLFDIIWDAAPDMMHILKNFWTNLLKIFNGQTDCKYPKKKQTVDKDGQRLSDEEIAEIEASFQELKTKYAALQVVIFVIVE